MPCQEYARLCRKHVASCSRFVNFIVYILAMIHLFRTERPNEIAFPKY